MQHIEFFYKGKCWSYAQNTCTEFFQNYAYHQKSAPGEIHLQLVLWKSHFEVWNYLFEFNKMFDSIPIYIFSNDISMFFLKWNKIVGRYEAL